MPLTSMPREAMSVATSTRARPERNRSSDFSRAPWLLLPCSTSALTRVATEVLGDAVGAVLGAGEHDHPIHRRILEQPRQQRALGCRLHEMHLLLDQQRRRDLGLDLDAHRIAQEALAELLDLGRHGRREQHRLALRRQGRRDRA